MKESGWSFAMSLFTNQSLVMHIELSCCVNACPCAMREFTEDAVGQ